MRSLEWVLIHYDWYPFQNRRQRHTRDDSHVTIQAEIKVMNLQFQQLSANTEGKKEARIPSLGFMALPTPWFWTSSFQNSERINSYCSKPPSLWCFVTVAIGN